MVGSTALLALVLGTGLFALATWTTRNLSRQASGLLAVGSVLTVVMLIGVSGGPGGDADESCARAGIKAVADELSF